MKLTDIGSNPNVSYQCANLIFTNGENTRAHVYATKGRAALLLNCRVGFTYRITRLVIRPAQTSFNLSLPYSLLFSFASEIHEVNF